jgi:hypothetical protein
MAEDEMAGRNECLPSLHLHRNIVEIYLLLMIVPIELIQLSQIIHSKQLWHIYDFRLYPLMHVVTLDWAYRVRRYLFQQHRNTHSSPHH